jgi:hypothetical protein
MIEPLENYIPPEVPRTDIERQERCAAALAHLRAAWKLMEDAGVAEPFKERMMSIATDTKAAMGGKEAGAT